MRTMIAALVISLSFADLSGAADVSPSTKKSTNIPAQGLGAALQSFAKERGLRVIYVSEEVNRLRTKGASGELTVNEVLTQLLNGTGLTYRYLENNAVSIMPIATNQERERGERTSQASSGMGESTQLALTQLGIADAGSVAAEEKTKRAQKGDSVEEMIVEEGRIKPFTDASVDIPRTTNDPQPYYIFDNQTIQRSAAMNIEDFLKKKLTMNTVARTGSQATGQSFMIGSSMNSSGGNTSAINLRGLGADSTLILINGRRSAGVAGMGNLPGQADLNGIPLDAVERIEVLPTSASGIYGGSALGGMINVVLKKDYSGGQARVLYDNTFDTNSARRTASVSYGMPFNEGKTRLMFNAQWSDSNELLLQDRRKLFDRGFQTILLNNPGSIYSSGQPFMGALPNITTRGENVVVPAGTPGAIGPFSGVYYLFVQPNLVLKRTGVSLNSPRTYIPTGTSSSTSTATLDAALLANAGQWSFDLPASVANPTGLLRQLTATPTVKSYGLSMHQRLSDSIDAEFGVTRNINNSVLMVAPRNMQTAASVAADTPYNPFTTAIRITLPFNVSVPHVVNSQSDSATLGFMAKLPHGWTAQADYTWSRNKYVYQEPQFDANVAFDDFSFGNVNPFVDVANFPLSVAKYLSATGMSYQTDSILKDAAIRGSGPLMALPWGVPTLTVGLEHRTAITPENTNDYNFTISTGNNRLTKYFERQQSSDSLYAELLVPLVKPNMLPMLYALELQLSGRSERFVVDAGTPSVSTSLVTGAVSYGFPNVNGQPFFAKDTYVSTNHTMGLKYQPLDEVILRGSIGTAFLPPRPDQLVKNPIPNGGTTSVVDPGKGQVQVQTISGGNPDIRPQNSKSWNAGIIWQPAATLKGLRLNAEYYQIEQFDAIGSLSAQTFVNNEGVYPGRVIRNAAGIITMVDTSVVNLYRQNTMGWDFSANYDVTTALGNFSFSAVKSLIVGLKRQFSLTLPELDSVNFPSESGAARSKANFNVVWDRNNWSAGWSAQYFSSYKQYGAAGGPQYAQNGGVVDQNGLIRTQGSDTIPSQMYHDAFVGYAFKSGQRASVLGFLNDVTLQFAVRNVFNKLPPIDVAFDYFTSPYGDARLRSYALSASKSF